jgi:serine/threonine protein kinase
MTFIINPKYNYLSDYIKGVPYHFDKLEGEPLYEARNVLRRVKVGDIELVIKSFHQPRFLNRIVYTFFRKSKAWRSYTFSNHLLEHGIYAPDPVACILESKHGLLSRSYYINRYLPADTVRDLMGGVVQGHEKELDAFATILVHLHEQGILHLDLSPGNVLIRPEGDTYSFFLIDVNRMKEGIDVDMPTACRNLRRLCTSREVLRYIAVKYARLRGWDEQQMSALAERLSDRFFLRFFYHRAATRSKARHIRFIILRFRWLRYWRQHLVSPTSSHAVSLFHKEASLYIIFLEPYDFRHLFTSIYHSPYIAE